MLQRRSVAPIFFLILAGTLAGTLAACSTSTPAEDEFQGALARWRRTGLVSYSFKSTISCFCSREYTTPKTVSVRGRVVVSVVDRETGVPSPVEYRQSIDSVFAMVRQELIARPSRLEVEYDPALGYPRRLKYGTPENDAGGYIYLDSVEVAP